MCSKCVCAEWYTQVLGRWLMEDDGEFCCCDDRSGRGAGCSCYLFVAMYVCVQGVLTRD